MRRVSVLLLIVLLSVALAVSCRDSGDGRGTSLTLRIEEGENTRTIMPAQALMDIQKYSISGSGPGGAMFGPVLSTDSEISIKDIAIGSWTITAKALNAQNNELAEGEATFNVKRGENSGTVVLDRIQGSGSLELLFNWEADICSEKQFHIVISIEGGGSRIIKEKTVLTSELKTSLVMNLAAGSHVLNVQLKDSEGNIGIGATEAVRIVANTRSSGTVNLKSVKPSTPTNGISIKIENNVGFPMNFYIDYTPKNLIGGRVMTLYARYSSLPAGVNQRDLRYQWYKDGVLMSTASVDNISLMAEAGMHRYDVIVRSNKEGTMCGASLNLNVAD